MKMMKLFNLLLLTLLFVAIPSYSLAVGVPPPQTTIQASIPNPLLNTNGTLLSLITDIINKIVMPIAAVGVVAWIIWAGFQFVIAQGNPTEIGKAKQNLLWSLVGAGILLGAVGISSVLTATINALIAP
jgi:hypothetical protein